MIELNDGHNDHPCCDPSFRPERSERDAIEFIHHWNATARTRQNAARRRQDEGNK